MAFSVRVIIFGMGVIVFLTIFELVRKKRFREELALIWLLIGPIVMISSFADRIIDPIAHRVGIHYPPTLIFLIIFFLFISALLYFSIVVSDLMSRNKELSQKIALLEYRVARLQQNMSAER